MSNKKSKFDLRQILILIIFAIIIGIVGYFSDNIDYTDVISNSNIISTDMQNIPDYSGNPYVIIDNNKPSFTEDDYTTNSFEKYSDLDKRKRCGVAYANICKEIMPLKTDDRESLYSVTPSGWMMSQINVQLTRKKAADLNEESENILKEMKNMLEEI